MHWHSITCMWLLELYTGLMRRTISNGSSLGSTNWCYIQSRCIFLQLHTCDCSCSQCYCSGSQLCKSTEGLPLWNPSQGIWIQMCEEYFLNVVTICGCLLGVYVLIYFSFFPSVGGQRCLGLYNAKEFGAFLALKPEFLAGGFKYTCWNKSQPDTCIVLLQKTFFFFFFFLKLSRRCHFDKPGVKQQTGLYLLSPQSLDKGPTPWRCGYPAKQGCVGCLWSCKHFSEVMCVNLPPSLSQQRSFMLSVFTILIWGPEVLVLWCSVPSRWILHSKGMPSSGLINMQCLQTTW